MLEVKKRKGESFESLMRRFSKRLHQSGKALQAKKIRYHSRNVSKNTMKASALRRIQVTAKRNYLIKIGRLVETFGRSRRR